MRSLPLREAEEEARRLAGEGYREIVLTGIEISSWGRDLRTGETLIDLIESVCAAAPDCRVRLGSLEPRTITEDFCVRAAGLPNLCPHFHLSLQSGCDATLKRMNRKYGTARYLESVDLLRKHFQKPGPAITTDLIVGFPGETTEEFEDTLRVLEEVRFDALFTFIFSPRQGTPAAEMDDPMPREEKLANFNRLTALQDRISEEKHAAYIGKTVRCLLDGLSDDTRYDLTARTPGNRLVRVVGDPAALGQFQDVKITGANKWSLFGELV